MNEKQKKTYTIKYNAKVNHKIIHGACTANLIASDESLRN